MKKFLMIALVAVLAVGLLACSSNTPAASSEAASSAAPASSEAASAAPASSEAAAGEKLTLNIGMYADGADSYYQVLHDTLQACADADPECDWQVDYKVGQNTPAEQIQAVEDFITSKYDAIVVIQNSPDATSECIEKAKAAGIPYFGACHAFNTVANAKDATGSCCYDFVQAGVYAGEDALARGIKRVINIEGQLGQGTAGAQSLGFLKAYEDAGKSLGGMTAQEIAEKKPNVSDLDGTQEVEIVGWASGGWFAEPAQKAMTDYITSLGPDGFDGVYAHNDPMMEGVIAAMTDAGLNPSDYWLGVCNGREMSWDWVKNKTVTMDVNQSAALEGDTVYQQIKAFFNGEEYRKYVHPYLTPYNVDDIGTKTLVPFSDTAEYMKQRAENKFPHDINGSEWTDIEGMS
jgi:ABC-type sugar transport system substrate-binding protein